MMPKRQAIRNGETTARSPEQTIRLIIKRIDELATIVHENRHMLEVQFKRIAALQADVDNHSALLKRHR